MAKCIYAIEPDIETGTIYEIVEIEVLEETPEHYILKGYSDLRKEEAFTTPEDAIEAYRTKLRKTLECHVTRKTNAREELANFERIFKLPATEDEPKCDVCGKD